MEIFLTWKAGKRSNSFPEGLKFTILIDRFESDKLNETISSTDLKDEKTLD